MEPNEQVALQEIPQGPAERPPSSEGPQQQGAGPMPDGAQVAGDLAQNMSEPQKASPEKQEQLKNIQAMITDMLYHPQTKDSVQAMLKSSPPHVAIPGATNATFQKFEDMVTQKQGKPMPLDMRLTAGVAMFSEMMELGEDMGIVPEDLPEENVGDLLRETMQQYIQKGLKTGSIDPIELQQQVEPLMSDEEKHIGMVMGQNSGTPGELTGPVAAEGMAQQRMAPLELKAKGLQQSNKQMTQALQGIATKPEEGEGGA